MGEPTKKDQFTRHLKSCPIFIRSFREKVNSVPVFFTGINALCQKPGLQSLQIAGIFCRNTSIFRVQRRVQPLHYAPRWRLHPRHDVIAQLCMPSLCTQSLKSF
jgi:hypothetical protein